jgi:iron complex outermembrane receptor protein
MLSQSHCAHRISRTGAAAILVAQCTLVCGAADAQTTGTSDGARISREEVTEIIVRARRVEENIQDVPVAVTAFSGNDLSARQIESAADLQYNVPSLSVTPSVNGNGANYGLRGQRQGIGNTQGVVTYLAEIPVTAQSTYRQTFDMASIEVLKGPQGTLFGANSNGGAILFQPRKPTEEFEAELQGALGSYSLRDVTGVVNVPVNDWLQVRAAANYVRRDGYTKNLNPCTRAYRPPAGAGHPPSSLNISPNCGRGGAQDDDRHESWRLSVAANPTDWLRNDLVYWGVNEDSVGTSWVPFRFGGPLAPVLFADPIAGLLGLPTAEEVVAEQEERGVRKVLTDEMSYRFKEDGISNVTRFDLGPVTIKNIYGYRATFSSQKRDQDGSILPFVQQDQWTDGRTKAHTDELQLIGSVLDDKVKYVVGGFISREKNPGRRTYAFLYQFTPEQNAILNSISPQLVFPNPVTGRLPPARAKTDTDAVFGNVDFDLSALAEGLRLSTGYRYTWNEVRTRAPQNLVNGACVAVPNRNEDLDAESCTLVSKLKHKGYNYSATLQYDISEDTMVYLATRRGFKPGGANDIAVVDPRFFFYEPEKITDYEIGVKSDLQLGGVFIRANIAAYTSTYRDVQRSEVLQQPTGVPAITTLNAQKATIQGIEPELTFRFGRSVDLSLFYSYLDAKFDEYEVPTPTGIFDKSGTKFTAVSKHSVGATLVYRTPIPQSWGELTSTANFYYRSKQTFADDNLNQPSDLIVPGYSIFNARLDWRLPSMPLTLSAAAFNLFDKEYAVGGADYTGSVVGYAINTYGPPRMFRLEAAYRF